MLRAMASFLRAVTEAVQDDAGLVSPEDAELAEGQDCGLGTYRLVTLGKSVKDVPATSQAAGLGTSQCSQKLVTSGRSLAQGRTAPWGYLAYGNGVCCTPNGCAWDDSDRS